MLQSLALKERTSIRLKLRLSEDATTICRTPNHPLAIDQKISFKIYCAALLLQTWMTGATTFRMTKLSMNDIQYMSIQHNDTQHKQWEWMPLCWKSLCWRSWRRIIWMWLHSYGVLSQGPCRPIFIWRVDNLAECHGTLSEMMSKKSVAFPETILIESKWTLIRSNDIQQNNTQYSNKTNAPRSINDTA